MIKKKVSNEDKLLAAAYKSANKRIEDKTLKITDINSYIRGYMKDGGSKY